MTIGEVRCGSTCYAGSPFEFFLLGLDWRSRCYLRLRSDSGAAALAVRDRISKTFKLIAELSRL
jgi:hypothetical protein